MNEPLTSKEQKPHATSSWRQVLLAEEVRPGMRKPPGGGGGGAGAQPQELCARAVNGLREG